VLKIDPASHSVTVGSDAELATRTLRANRLNWIGIPELTAPMRVRAKIRHRHEPAWATLEPVGLDEVVATFDEPQRAVTPGQSAVFYDGDEVVGGGWII
jgi:tRNA-specific 2-thiouridylase